MKKTALIFAFTFGVFNAFCQSNLDFEKWDINYNGVDEAKSWVNTSNATKYGAPATLLKEVDNPASGLAYMKITTAYWEEGTTYQLDTLVGSLIQQTAYSKRPISFNFSYKAKPKNGDEVLVGVQLTTTINDSLIVVGEGFFTSNQTVSDWTTQTVDIEYYSNHTPDNINIVAVSSANAVISNGTNGYAKIGSTLYLDNLKLNVEPVKSLESEYFIHVFPNPAKSHINVETNSPDHQQIQIYDLSSKLVINSSFNHQTRIDISNLPSGTYIYKVYSTISGETTATNKFNVVR